MTKVARYQVKDMNGNVLISTNKNDIYDYCQVVFRVTEEVAGRPNYIVTNGLRFPEDAEMTMQNLKEMLELENKIRG